MVRMGHGREHAAIIYQDEAAEADLVITSAMSPTYPHPARPGDSSSRK